MSFSAFGGVPASSSFGVIPAGSTMAPGTLSYLQGINRLDYARHAALCALTPLNSAGTKATIACLNENAQDYVMDGKIRADLIQMNNTPDAMGKIFIGNTMIDPSMIMGK